ncbi:MAG TPA: NfeD family protein, partial [Mycobacteriales bacterium]|nr:NfeD family protein [Mycobacteriales bacterium]
GRRGRQRTAEVDVMGEEMDDREVHRLMRQAFDPVAPDTDPVPAARQAGIRLQRRRGAARLAATAVLLGVLIGLTVVGWHVGVTRPGGGEVGGVAVWLLWLIAAGLFAIAEVLSTDLVLIMCAAGALLAAGATGIGVPVAVQVAVFAVSSVGLVGLVRPAARRRLALSAPPNPTGVDALVGQQAVVVRTVDGWGGRVRLAGEEWSARAYDSTQVLAEGAIVRVMEIRGAEAMVWGGL